MKTLTTQFILLAAASPALASEQAGMPQMDPTWFANQLFWLALCFAVFYVVVSKFIVPKVGGTIAAREATITQAIAKAEQLKRTADNAKGNYEAAGSEARSKASTIIAAAQAEAAKKAADAQAKLATELDTQTQAAYAGIAKAKSKAAAELETAAAELAQSISEKLLGAKLDSDNVKAAVATRLRA